MATIKKQGRGYKITVSNGFNYTGDRIRDHMTWVPDPGMTPRQIEKELNRQAVLFEEKIKATGVHNGNIKFADFAKIFIRDHAEPHLKEKTIVTYLDCLKAINPAIGHIRLQNLRPKHLNDFYNNLAEEGIRVRELAYAKVDFAALLKERRLTMAELHRRTGVAVETIRRLKLKKPISKKNAQTLATAMKVPPYSTFTYVRDLTPLSPRSISVYHRTISAILGRAVKWGYIDTNPASRVDLPRAEPHEAAYLDEEDARRLLVLLRVEPIKWQTIFIFDLLSGLRRSELLGLRWSDIDWKRHLIYIRQTHHYSVRKGCYDDTTKSHTSRRPLKVSNSAFVLLEVYREWQDHQRELLGDAWEDQDSRIFTTDAGAPMHPDSVSKWFSDFIKRSGLPKVTVHSLRHTYASLMIFDGIPLVTVSHQLGHAQTSTTANIYAHVVASAEAMAAQTFDRFDAEIIPDWHQSGTKTKIS